MPFIYEDYEYLHNIFSLTQLWVCCINLLLCLVSFSGEFHIGFNDVEIQGKSWYDLIHPDDLYEAKDKHVQCMHHEMLIKLQLPEY